MNNKKLTDDILARARKVKLLLMDCDGVLTDGRLYFTERGEEMKVFHVRDGQGIVNWHAAGFRSGIISGRDAGSIIRRRSEELGIEFVRVASPDKTKDLTDILKLAGLSPEETAFVGDDIGDVDLMRSVGFPVAVGDAVDQCLEAAVYVTKANGGFGAIREVTDLLLSSKQS